MNDDPAAFLTARLDEREAGAREVIAHSARARESTGLRSTLWDEEDADALMALREVEADRKLLAEREEVRSKFEEFSGSRDRELPGWWAGRVIEIDRIIRIRAAIWDSHPDYDAQWKP